MKDEFIFLTLYITVVLVKKIFHYQLIIRALMVTLYPAGVQYSRDVIHFLLGYSE